MDVGLLVFVISCLCIILSGIYSVFEKSLANLLTGILILTFVLTYCLSIDFKYIILNFTHFGLQM